MKFDNLPYAYSPASAGISPSVHLLSPTTIPLHHDLTGIRDAFYNLEDVYLQNLYAG
jgi:hypothetical protein